MKVRLLSALAAASLTLNALATSNHAARVVSYEPGTGFTTGYTNTPVVLGEPSRVNPWGDAVEPFNPPYDKTQLLSVGAGGALTIEFEHPILNTPQKPFGADFIIFGNTGFVMTNDWDPETWLPIGEPATDGSLFGNQTGSTRVSVSADGQQFYELDPALAPTVDNIFPPDGTGRFDIPVDPSLRVSDFTGATAQNIRVAYRGSAGGTAYDISWARGANGEPVRLPMIRYVRVAVLSGKSEIDAFAAVTSGIVETFATNPLSRGWRTHGDSSLFQWNSTNRNLEVTWDSSRTNSYFWLPLGTILGANDDFSLAFDLRLNDVNIGTSPGKQFDFEVGLGFLNMATATDTNFFRGAGTSSTYGPRNLVEFDYFPDSGYGATVAPTIIMTNHVIVPAHSFPLEMTAGDLFHIVMTFTSSNRTLHTTATKNGAPFGLVDTNGIVYLADLVLTNSTQDFRVDTLAISSYSDAIQVGPPTWWGSVLAHGTVANLVATIPDPPVCNLSIGPGAASRAQFVTRTNWLYALERTIDFTNWTPASPTASGDGSAMWLDDTNAAGPRGFYRVRAMKP